jgi:hypothetical protein
MTIVSRLLLDHPALGTAGGAALHSDVEDLFIKIGDNTNARYFTEDGLADSASVDFEHNFKCAFDDLRFDLYTRVIATGELTEVTDLSNWTIEATPGNLTTQIRVTNNTGSAEDISLVVLQDPIGLAEMTDVDLSTPAEEGQTIVWDSTASQFKPGASGDSSFKVQSVGTDGATVIKGGSFIDNKNRELATYDGAGTVEGDFGKDLAIDLDNLESSPVNDTTYYLYIDENTLTDPTTLTDYGRDLYPIQEANLVLLTDGPADVSRSRYHYLGYVRRATGAWSDTVFGSSPKMRMDPAVIAVSPVAYSATATVTGHGGATGTITHNKNVPVNDQLWVAFYNDGTDEYQFDAGSWITDKDENSVDYDFSSLNLTDTVTVKLINLGVTPTVIPVDRFDRTFTSDPNLAATPIATNLAEHPVAMIIQRYDGVDWVDISNVGDYIKIGPAPARELRGDISGLSPSSANPIRIVLSSAAMAIAVNPNERQSVLVSAAGHTMKRWEHADTDTSGGAFSMNLPAGPTYGDVCEITDATGSWGSNNLTVGRNGENINGAASDYTLSGSASGAKFKYINSSEGWRVMLYA